MPHQCAAFNLAFDGLRINGLADIVGANAFQDRDLTGFSVDCHFDGVTAVGEIGKDWTLPRLFIDRIGEGRPEDGQFRTL